MNKYWWSLQGRWSLSAHVRFDWRKWGIGARFDVRGPGADPDAPLHVAAVLTVGPAHVDVAAELLTEDMAAIMRDPDDE
jgi:hypothetical protein